MVVKKVISMAEIVQSVAISFVNKFALNDLKIECRFTQLHLKSLRRSFSFCGEIKNHGHLIFLEIDNYYSVVF